MIKVFSCLTHLKSWMLELDRNEFQYKVLMSFQLLLFTEEVEDIVGLFHPTLIFRDKSNFRLPISFMWLLGGLWVWETWLSFYFYQLFYERKSILVAPTIKHRKKFHYLHFRQGNNLAIFYLTLTWKILHKRVLSVWLRFLKISYTVHRIRRDKLPRPIF